MTLPVGVYLPGVSGEYISTPDHADLDITGDICLVAHVALDDWTPTTATSLVGKWAAGDQAFLLQVANTGVLRFYYYDTLQRGPHDSSVAPTVSDGGALWVAATRDQSAGELKFWTSTDGTSWSQLGSTDTGLRLTSLGNSAQPVTVGAHSGGTGGLGDGGTIYEAKVYDGIGANTAPGLGTLVAEFNPLLPVEPRYRDSTGKIWTMNGSAWAFEGAAS